MNFIFSGEGVFLRTVNGYSGSDDAAASRMFDAVILVTSLAGLPDNVAKTKYSVRGYLKHLLNVEERKALAVDGSCLGRGAPHDTMWCKTRTYSDAERPIS